MTKAKNRKLYLVQEVLWEPKWNLNEPYWADDYPQNPHSFFCPDIRQGRPVRFFSDRSAAEKFQVREESKFQQERNPFHYGENLEDLTTMPAGVFHDWLLDVGLTPPWHKSRVAPAWSAWWEEQKMTEEHRARVWQALDRVRFFTVVPLEATET